MRNLLRGDGRICTANWKMWLERLGRRLDVAACRQNAGCGGHTTHIPATRGYELLEVTSAPLASVLREEGSRDVLLLAVGKASDSFPSS